MGKAISAAISYLNDMKVSLGGTSDKVLTSVAGAWSASTALSPFLRGETALGGPNSSNSLLEQLSEKLPSGPGKDWVIEGETARVASLKKSVAQTLQVSAFFCNLAHPPKLLLPPL